MRLCQSAWVTTDVPIRRSPTGRLTSIRDAAHQRRFHDMLQASVSHYTMGEDPSERLMLKYYEYLLRTRDLAKARFNIDILGNLHKFPLNTDPALREYHEKIAILVDTVTATLVPTQRADRYYIHHSRPFFVRGRIYYESRLSESGPPARLAMPVALSTGEPDWSPTTEQPQSSGSGANAVRPAGELGRIRQSSDGAASAGYRCNTAQTLEVHIR